MPGGDQTGPLGLGPMTGRAAGFCAGYGAPGFTSYVPGRGVWGGGRGRGRGGGRGWRHWYYATGLTGWQRARRGGPWPYPTPFEAPAMTREQEINALQAELRCLEETAGRLRQRMEELKAEASG